MPMSEMARYAWAVYGSRRKYNQIVTRAHGMKATVNNIYAVGDYFFIDFSLRNKTKIPYDIEEIRVKLTDKKETKATNSQYLLVDIQLPKPHEEVQEGLPQRDGAAQADLSRREGAAH